MHELTELIRNDMRPALGVTEPGAIAFSAATAKQYARGEVRKVRVSMNSGMFKNAYTCGIPNSNHVGNLYSAALGVIAGKAELGLESLSEVTEEDNRRAEEMVTSGMVEVTMECIDSEILIRTEVETELDTCQVLIRHTHTNIVQISRNGEIIFESNVKDGKNSEIDAKSVIHSYTVGEILQYVTTVPAEEISWIDKAFEMNLALLNLGLKSSRTVFSAYLLEKNQNEIFTDDLVRTAQLLSSGAIEARVLGLPGPAMSITGSGAHGIIAVMPLYAVYKAGKCNRDCLRRAALLSYLICTYIKEYSGRLSAFCGCAIAAGTGAACGLAYLSGKENMETLIAAVIRNMASGITGMICDGGNHGCTMKGVVAVDAAFRAVDFALQGISIAACHGINAESPEETMKHMGQIASPGMVHTEETIVQILTEKSLNNEIS